MVGLSCNCRMETGLKTCAGWKCYSKKKKKIFNRTGITPEFPKHLSGGFRAFRIRILLFLLILSRLHTLRLKVSMSILVHCKVLKFHFCHKVFSAMYGTYMVLWWDNYCNNLMLSVYQPRKAPLQSRPRKKKVNKS